MNQITTALDGATPVSAPMDIVRAQPRRVVGFTTLIETSLPMDELRESLESLAAVSAFRLEGLSREDHCIRAEFTLTARRGTTGDPQIFALLREIAARHRWNTMEKRLVR
ncbi:MAG: hypothetical protein AAGF49_13130 [Pseudomonadota bacterium]